MKMGIVDANNYGAARDDGAKQRVMALVDEPPGWCWE